MSSGGVVICQKFDSFGSKSAFLIFDAVHIASGLRAVLSLHEPPIWVFHAVFALFLPE
jgi:hypothetical protein